MIPVWLLVAWVIGTMFVGLVSYVCGYVFGRDAMHEAVVQRARTEERREEYAKRLLRARSGTDDVFRALRDRVKGED